MNDAELNRLIERLEALADPKYRDFSASLDPGMGRTLGVRLPILRGISRELAKGDWCGFLDASRSSDLYELRLLYAMTLGGCRCPVEEKIALTEAFLPFVNGWSVCDALVSSYKPRPADKPALFDYVCACALSDGEFRKRFGLIMLMDYYREAEWADQVLEVYRQFRHEGYYARMGAAWGLATLFLTHREGSLAILRDGIWDGFTHNKAIQKIKESYRVSAADKALVDGLRRKPERRKA